MRVEWALPETLPELPVPTLSIQPLVENAIHHGVEPSSTECLLRIAVEPDDKQVRISVSNDLPSPPAASGRHGHGVGLRAVRERVEAMGGRVETRVEDGRYQVTVTLDIAP